MKNKTAVLAILLVLVSSGCTYLDSLIGTTIQGISIKETTQKETADILTISNVDTLPRSPIFADQPFTLYLTIKNNDKTKTAESVSVRLFDPSIFLGSTSPSECAYSCTIPPGGEKTISFELRTPSSKDIAYSRTTKSLSFMVTYYFESKTMYGVVVLDRDEIIRQQQAGKTVSVTSEKQIGSGPVKIYPELDGEKFVMSGTERSLKITLRDEGSGSIQNSRIEKSAMRIEFPSGFSPTGNLLSRSIFDDIAASGNAIVTGMATGCDSRCGNYIPGDISGGCSASCSCDGHSECASGLSCVPYGSTGEFWCQASSTTTTTNIAISCSNNPTDKCDSSLSCPSGSFCDCPDECASGLTCGSNYKCQYPSTTTTSGTTRTTIANPRNCNEYCLNALGGSTSTYDVKDAITSSKQYSDPCSELLPFCVSGTCSYGCRALSLTSDQLTRIGLGADDICYCFKTSSCNCGTGGSKYCTNSGCSSTPGGGGGYTTTTYYSSKTFSCSGSVCTNIIPIDIFGDQSSPLIFRISGPSAGDLYTVYDITATVGYTYELRGSKEITIVPVETS